MNEISLSYDEYIKVWQTLEELRVSLDRIGGYDDKEVLKDKLFSYIASGIFKKGKRENGKTGRPLSCLNKCEGVVIHF